MIKNELVASYWQLGWAHVLLWIAGAGRTGDARPEVHLYLADLHFKLAAQFEAQHKWTTARKHRRIANEHAALGPPLDPKPAVAVAMPVPRAPIFTDARGKAIDYELPDEPA